MEVSEEGCNFVGERKIRSMKKIEDYKLPTFRIPMKVLECMKRAVERAIHDSNDWAAHRAAPEVVEITVWKYRPIFESISDCEFKKKWTINATFKEVIDAVFDVMDEVTVLHILNDAYAIAIDTMNNDFPEWQIGKYRSIAAATSSNVIVQQMVMAFAVSLIYPECPQAPSLLKITLSDNPIAYTIHETILGLREIDEFIMDADSRPEEEKWEEKRKVKLAELKHILEEITPKKYHVGPFLDTILGYAETLPPAEQRVIGHMLHAEGGIGGCISEKVYQNYEQRIDKLANCKESELGGKDDNAEKNTAKDETTTNDADELDTDEKDKKIQAAIDEWLKGDSRDKCHWFAVFKALVARNLQPNDMKVFCERMHDWGYKQVTYSSVSKPNQWELPDKAYKWIDMQRTARGKELKMIQAFLNFRDCLKNQGL